MANDNSEPARKTSIVTDAMRKLGIRVAIVVVAVTAITYFHVVNVVQGQALEHLEKFSQERVKFESNIFLFVKDGHAVVKKQLLAKLASLKGTDPKTRFYKEVERFPDGVTRTKLAGFNGQVESFVYVGKQVQINADIRRQVMLFLDLSNQFGPAWNHRLEDFYITTPTNILVGYWPGFPNWAHAAPADLWMPDEEYVYVADMKHNPERKTVWTGLYYDPPSDVWLISTETPVDINGKQIATIGSDITLNRLMERTINNRIKGTYNLIFRGDGRLIAHPELIDEIKAKKGHYEIADSENTHLKQIYQLVGNDKTGKPIIHNKEYNEFLAVQQLEGPGWYFVTVYPENVLNAVASSTARIVLLLGALSLLVELIFLYRVMTNQVSKPLAKLARAVNKVADGDHDIQLEHERPDELGRISEAFKEMARKVDTRTRDLEAARNKLEEKVTERTRELEQTQEVLIKKERLAALGQLTATVSHELRNPLSAISTSLYLLKSKGATDSDLFDRSVERIERNTERCDQIIDELLDFTRTADISPESLVLDQWLRLVLDDLQIPEGIELQLELGAGDTKLEFDPHRLRRVVINVVDNACQAMQKQEGDHQPISGARLQIRTRVDDTRASIRITDNGIGMDPEVQQQMFEPLYSTRGFGVGLGMSIIQQIMNQHQGDIEVDSEPGRGTTVTLRLPLATQAKTS